MDHWRLHCALLHHQMGNHCVGGVPADGCDLHEQVFRLLPSTYPSCSRQIDLMVHEKKAVRCWQVSRWNASQVWEHPRWVWHCFPAQEHPLLPGAACVPGRWCSWGACRCQHLWACSHRQHHPHLPTSTGKCGLYPLPAQAELVFSLVSRCLLLLELRSCPAVQKLSSCHQGVVREK